jgi:MFS superfamily sulfate permease-like transporter
VVLPKQDLPKYVIIDLSEVKYIDVDGLDCLKNIHKKMSKFHTFGFVNMKLYNAVFESSDFVKNSGNFYEGLEVTMSEVLNKGPVVIEQQETMEGGQFDDEYKKL